MKTTLVLDEALVAKLRAEAQRRKISMSAVAAEALARWFDAPPGPRELPPLPTFSMGTARVDIANREALEEFIEKHDRRDERLYGRKDRQD